MINYAVKATTVPSNTVQAAHVERWLEECSRRGGELVTFMPTTNANTVVAVFKVSAAGALNAVGQ